MRNAAHHGVKFSKCGAYAVRPIGHSDLTGPTDERSPRDLRIGSAAQSRLAHHSGDIRARAALRTLRGVAMGEAGQESHLEYVEPLMARSTASGWHLAQTNVRA